MRLTAQHRRQSLACIAASDAEGGAGSSAAFAVPTSLTYWGPEEVFALHRLRLRHVARHEGMCRWHVCSARGFKTRCCGGSHGCISTSLRSMLCVDSLAMLAARCGSMPDSLFASACAETAACGVGAGIVHVEGPSAPPGAWGPAAAHGGGAAASFVAAMSFTNACTPAAIWQLDAPSKAGQRQRCKGRGGSMSCGNIFIMLTHVKDACQGRTSMSNSCAESRVDNVMDRRALLAIGGPELTEPCLT